MRRKTSKNRLSKEISRRKTSVCTIWTFEANKALSEGNKVFIRPISSSPSTSDVEDEGGGSDGEGGTTSQDEDEYEDLSTSSRSSLLDIHDTRVSYFAHHR